MSKAEGSWEIETLMRKAFQRVKERFLTYILAYILMYALIFGSIILFFVVGAFAAGAFVYKATILTGLLFAILAVLGIVAFMYIAAFTQLLVIHVIIRKEKGTLMQNINEVKEHVWGFVWVEIALYAFLIGLLPIGLLSLFVILILWSLWSSFYALVYLEHKKKGLDNVWASYMMVRTRFWGIAGRMIIVIVAYLIIISIISLPDNDILNIVQFIVSVLFGPFMLSYQYEIYTLLDVPAKVERPKLWVWLSIIGYVIIGLVVIGSADEISKSGPRLREFFQEYEQRENDFDYTPNNQSPSRDGVTNASSSYV